jgi:copper chaperone CopZ
MTCDGCLNAVKRSLNKNLGPKIISIEGDLTEQVIIITKNNNYNSTIIQLLHYCQFCVKALSYKLSSIFSHFFATTLIVHSLNRQSVTVKLNGSESLEEVLELVKKAGKETSVF